MLRLQFYILLGKHIEANVVGKAIAYIGKDSFYVMALHFVGFKLCSLSLNIAGCGGERPRTSAYNSELLQSESLAEVSCPVSSKVGPFLGRLNSHISKDAYKLKVEELKTDVLGRAGGGNLADLTPNIGNNISLLLLNNLANW